MRRLVTPMFSDSHPRVRYAACQCVYILLHIALFACTKHSRLQWAAMCGLGGNTTRVSRTDVNFIYLLCSGNYSRNIRGQLFAVPITTLDAPEPRSVPHQGVERDILLLYLDPIVERLLKLLNPTGENATQPKRYVHEQAPRFPWRQIRAKLPSPR